MVTEVYINISAFTLLVIILWYCYINREISFNHRKIYMIMIEYTLAGVIVNFFRIMTVYYADSFSPVTIMIIYFVYYSMIMLTFLTFYAYNVSLLNNYDILSKLQKFIVMLPFYTGIVCNVLSFFTEYGIFKIIDNKFGYGQTYLVVYVVVLIYTVLSVIIVHKYKSVLPINYIKCNRFCVVLFFGNSIAYCFRANSLPIFMALSICLLLILLSMTSYDNICEFDYETLNRKGYTDYARILALQNIPYTAYLVDIKEYEYIDSVYGGRFNKFFIKNIAQFLRGITTENTIYYLDKGFICVIVRKDNKKFNEKDFIDKLNDRFSRPWHDKVPNSIFNVDLSIIRYPDDIDDYDILLDMVDYNETEFETREEKVKVIRGEELEVEKKKRIKNVEAAIEKALNNNGFLVYYQPIYSVEDKKIISAEALIRLFDDNLGNIPPDEFIPIAERNGSILRIGLYVFEEVCRFIRDNDIERLGIKYIEVNMSVMQCVDDGIRKQIKELMTKYNVRSDQINLEITETAAAMNMTKMKNNIDKLASDGLKFSLDDYGTGYSNMNSVLTLPLDLIKLDKEIVWSAFENKDASIAVHNLVEMFVKLDKGIVAEGVETEEQKAMLEKMGCKYLQGYLISRPLPQEDFLKFIHTEDSK